jgi:hypothetical protein
MGTTRSPNHEETAMKINQMNVIEPQNFTEASRILSRKSNAKGFPENSVVYLYNQTLSSSTRSKVDRNMVVVGGTAERPVQVYIESGMNVVEVVSGHAVLACESNYGNVVYAQEGSTVTIESAPNRKVTVTGDGDITFKSTSAENRLRDHTPPHNTVKVVVEEIYRESK